MRFRVYQNAQFASGSAAAGRTLTVYDDAAGTVESTIYTTATGAVEESNPYTVPATGQMDFWIDQPQAWGKAQGETTIRPLRLHQTPIIVNVLDYGATGDGTTDDSTAVLAALADLDTSSGGVLYFPAGTYRIDSQLLIPSTDGTYGPSQVPITLRGDGAKSDALYGRADYRLGGTALDLRYSGTTGKIETLGWGSLNIEDLHLTQAAGADDDTPFVYSTKTVTRIKRVTVSGHSTLSGTSCVQDAFVFGGTTSETRYQGYTSEVVDCIFDRIRSGIALRYASNAFRAENCGWTINCGSGSSAAAIDIDAGDGDSIGSLFIHMTTEGDYPYRIRIDNANNNVFIGGGFWDTDENLIACVRLEGTATSNVFFQMWDGGVDEADYVSRASSSNGYRWIAGLYDMSEVIFRGGYDLAGVGQAMVIIRPGDAPEDGADHRLLSLRRSLTEGTNPNLEVFKVCYDGDITTTGGLYTAGAHALGTSGLVQTGTGNLDLYGGTAATSTVAIARGVLKLRALTTAGRPAANAGAGAVYYDTTISKPVFSDGSKWRDAAGTEVPDA